MLPAKRPRLSTSCNWCRSHKLKCDTGHPSCFNCCRKGIECVTTDLRKGGSIGRRVQPAGRHQRRPRDPLSPPRDNGPRSTGNDQSPGQLQHEQILSMQATEKINSPTSDTISSRTSPPTQSSDAGSELPIFSLPFNLNDKADDTGDANESLQDLTLAHINGNLRVVDSQGIVADSRAAEDMQISGGTDLTILTDNSLERLQMMGSSSSLYILVQWLDLFFAQRPDWSQIFPQFRHGMAYTVEMPLPFPVSLPPLPPTDQREEYISIFFSRIQPIFPILDPDTFQSSITALALKMESSSANLNPVDYPSLACAYAVFSISADEKSQCITEDGTRYLEAAYFLHAHLFAIPYVTSVQALLLLTIVLRGRNKDGASWSTLGQAIRIAQSIGLHRYISRPVKDIRAKNAGNTAPSAKQQNLHSRIWWTAYCLERIMELETGRPSAIQDSECDQILPTYAQENGSFDYFGALIGLAKLQTQISDRLYRRKSVKRRTEQLLHDTGMLDRALLDWAEKLPQGMRLDKLKYSGLSKLMILQTWT